MPYADAVAKTRETLRELMNDASDGKHECSTAAGGAKGVVDGWGAHGRVSCVDSALVLYVYGVYTSSMSRSVRAKVFWSGGSQAIRVPKALRLSSEEVRIERRGKALVISPIAEEEGWGGFWDRLVSLRAPVVRAKTRSAERRRQF